MREGSRLVRVSLKVPRLIVVVVCDAVVNGIVMTADAPAGSMFAV